MRRFYASFRYQAQSWSRARRVVAKVEWHPGELYPRVGFIVTNLRRSAGRVIAFYNGRGRAEQWIKEGEHAVKWTRLSCTTFRANAVRLQLHALAYNLANFLRTLALPGEIAHPDGKFCGCDRDVKDPGGRIRYTMSDEAAGGQFVCTGASGQLAQKTEGTMKSIAFRVSRDGQIDFTTASQAGHQVHFGVSIGNGAANNTESILASVPLTNPTRKEIHAIHNQCVTFCDAHPANNCPALAP